MGIISSVKDSISSLSSPQQWLINLLGGGSTASGINVNEEKSMKYSAVYNAVTIYAFTLASLPLFLYQREDKGKSKATQHHLYKLLHDQPNPEMTSWSWRVATMAHILLWGNGYTEIDYDNAGRVKALWPLLPNKTWPMRDERAQELYYVTTLPSGKQVKLPKERVLHIPGLGFNGIQGRSIISFAREGVGLGLATEKYGAGFFGNGSNPGGVLEHPGKLKGQAAKRLKQSWEEKHQGLDNAHRVAILEEGMQWKQIGIPPEDAQFLETRKFQVTEVARWFNLPPHMLKDLERATFSNIEQQSLEFVIFSLLPWLKNWEQSFKKDLISNNRFFAEFVVDGLLRGDIESRYNAYSIGRQWGWLSINDIRKLENMNEVENGDTRLQPLNMIPIDQSSQNPKLESNSKPLTAEQRQKKIKEIRARRSAAARKNVASRYKKVIRNSAENLIKTEVGQVRSKAKEELKSRNAGNFKRWLEDFYEEFPEQIRSELSPVITTFAEAISEVASEEVGLDEIDGLERFIDNYLDTLAIKHSRYSRNQIKALVEEALNDDNDMFETVNQRLDEWEEKRPDKIATRESTKGNGAFTKFVYGAAGITTIRWVTLGDDPCPYCQEMNGKVVGIEQSFLSKEDSLEVDDRDEPLDPDGNIGHPPLHGGCECGIAAG
jgi:HK97 family phage portal protein